MRKDEFFLADLMKLLPSVNVPSFQKWVSMGLIEATFDPGTPAGKRIYSRANLREAFFVSELAAYGVPTSLIKEWINQRAPHEKTPKLKKRLRSEDCSGFFMYGRGPVSGKDKDLYRRNPGLQWYTGDNVRALEPENTFSHIMVNLKEISKEIDRRLDEEHWL